MLTRLGTNHPWVKGIQVCSNEGDSPSSSGDDSKRVTEKLEKKLLQNQVAKVNQTCYKLYFGERNLGLFR
jgi:hypothetical protein